MDDQPQRPRPHPPVAVVVVHAPSDKSIKKFTLYDHPNDSTDSSASSNTSKHAHDADRRRHALLELVDSEQAYVADLHTLLDVYLARLPAMLPALDAALVSRNAAELLAFHTAFARTLAVAGSCDAERVDGAIAAVAQAFLDAASGFSIYDAFCHGHLAASEALRRLESRAEYAAFERTCAALASPAPPHLQHAATAPPPERTPSSSRLSILAASIAHPGRPRRHSLGASASGSSDAVFARGHAHSASGSSSASTPAAPAPALHFADLLIKPVQRICRYPLLLAQLVPASPRPGDGVLHAAIQAMRGAAAAADDASQRADAAYRSQLIRTRIGLSTTAPIFAPKEVLPAAFLDSLGVVRFAGSLDVAHQQQLVAEPSKTRHLGIFVYDGGYVVMVKVLRNKVYEPKHWFALTGACAVEELESTDFAFRISTANGHRFDCFTTSEREKNLYLSALEEARAAAPRWSAGDELRYSSLHSAASSLTPSAGPSSAMASPEPTTIPLPDDTPVTPVAPKRTLTMGSLNKRHSLPLSMAVTVSGHERADRGLDDVMSSAYAQARNQARLSTIGLSMSERRLSTMTVGGLTMTRAASDRGVVRKRPSSNWLAPQLESLFAAAPTPPAEEVESDGYAWEVIDPEGDARNSPSHKRRFFARSEASVLPSPTRSLFSSRSATSASTGAGASAQRWWASLRRRVKSSPGLPLLGSFSSRDVSQLPADEPEEAAPSSIEEEEAPHLLLPPKEKGGKGGLLQRANTLTLPILTRRQRPKMPSPSPSVSSSSAETPGTDEALPLPAPATLGRRRPRPPPSSKRYVDHTLPPPKPLARGRSLLGSLRGMTPLRAES